MRLRVCTYTVPYVRMSNTYYAVFDLPTGAAGGVMGLAGLTLASCHDGAALIRRRGCQRTTTVSRRRRHLAVSGAQSQRHLADFITIVYFYKWQIHIGIFYA
jgi:hypothetical protein